jgi:hypothetical protein
MAKLALAAVGAVIGAAIGFEIGGPVLGTTLGYVGASVGAGIGASAGSYRFTGQRPVEGERGEYEPGTGSGDETQSIHRVGWPDA